MSIQPDGGLRPGEGWGGLGPCPCLFAEGCGEVVHCEAVGTEEVGGGGIAAHRAGRDMGRRVGEAREDEHAVGGEFARVFAEGS